MMFFSSGDGPFFYQEEISALSWLPKVWESFKGFGENVLPRLWIDYPFRLIVKILASLGLGWGVIEKMLWLIAIAIGVVGIYKLTKFVVGRNAAYLAVILYITNTYSLFLFGGGQLGVALAYGLAPLVLLKFIRYEKKDIQNGLWFALLILFDLRLAYVVLAAIVLYQGIARTFRIRNMGISLFAAAVLHAFWILPTLLTGVGSSALGEDFTNPGMLKFLSVADFSHSLSLLHPNWPENLFGKVYFLQPEFLVIPFIAFCSMVFVKQAKNKKHILFFGLLALLGAFFAKGVNPPFGSIFNWCFRYIPGFVMFRDPTKFYLFTAIGYAVLIPYTLERLSKKSKKLRWVFYGAFIIFWCFTIRPLFLGTLSGNFKPQSIPQEYIQVKDMLVSDKTPSRTLWIPTAEKFVYSSDTHPMLSVATLYPNTSLSQVLEIATSSAFLPKLSESGVRYVIVPTDIEGKMFMTDYQTDTALREQVISVLEETPLTRRAEYQQIAVFENDQFSFHSEIPTVVESQEYWSKIGLIAGAVAFVIFVFIMIKKRKPSY
ncbi:MAG: hypothetical protein WAV51_02785 [Microgenomates group bacterium]